MSFVQGPEDTVADLLPNDAQTQQSADGTAHPRVDDTALTEHAKLLLGSIVQKYHSTRPQLTERVLYVTPMETNFGRTLSTCSN